MPCKRSEQSFWCSKKTLDGCACPTDPNRSAGMVKDSFQVLSAWCCDQGCVRSLKWRARVPHDIKLELSGIWTELSAIKPCLKMQTEFLILNLSESILALTWCHHASLCERCSQCESFKHLLMKHSHMNELCLFVCFFTWARLRTLTRACAFRSRHMRMVALTEFLIWNRL